MAKANGDLIPRRFNEQKLIAAFDSLHRIYFSPFRDAQVADLTSLLVSAHTLIELGVCRFLLLINPVF